MAEEALKLDAEYMRNVGYKIRVVGDECYIAANYRVNKHNLSKAQIDEMESIERHNPKLALAFCLGLVGVSGNIVYECLQEHHLTPIMEEGLVRFTGGVDYGPKTDATTAVLVGINYEYTKRQVLGAYRFTNKTESHKKNINDFVNDILTFYDYHSQVFPQLLQYGLVVYVDSKETALLQVLQSNAAQYKCKQGGGYIRDWIKFKECEKPRKMKRAEIDDWCFSTDAYSFWYDPNSEYQKNKVLPFYYYSVPQVFNEYRNSQKELARTNGDGVGYKWVIKDHNDDLRQACEYAVSFAWKKISKGSYITWEN